MSLSNNLNHNTKINKVYIDDLYGILYDCKDTKKYVNIILKKYKNNLLEESHMCYIKFVMYINRENTKKIYDFMRFLVEPNISETLLNAIEINKFVSKEKYGLFVYIIDTENIYGGPIIIYNNDLHIDIIYNNKELFSTEYYFNKLDI
jgi:hypothetical protein